MNIMINKLVDSNFLTKEQADIIESIKNEGSSIIISGHRGHGTLILLASIGALYKEDHTVTPLKKYEQPFVSDDSYYLIGDIKDASYEDLFRDVFNSSQNVIGLKDNEHPFSILKLLKEAYKVNGAKNTYYLLECDKENDIKYLKKITKAYFDDSGKLKRESL